MKRAPASYLHDSIRLPLEIPIPAYFLDHHVQGKAVLPAVEALQVLAETVRNYRPAAAVTVMTGARFDKFFPVPSGRPQIGAFAEMETPAGGPIRALLLSRLQSKNSSMTRSMVHAAVGFPQETPAPEALPLDLQACLEGVCTEVSPEALYRDLVPFGLAYRNIAAPLYVSADGALARIDSPEAGRGSGGMRLLGSPFVLDAAFHAACVWAQRYRSIVAFPVGFERRTVYRPTRAGGTFLARIAPVRTEGRLLSFDIAISDPQGTLYESLRDVLMRDVSGGRVQPPAWIKQSAGSRPLARIRGSCRALSLLEIKTLAPFAEHCLSEYERKRFDRMGPKRRPSYLAARLACKRLSRMLAGGDSRTPAAAITTVCADSVRPCCRPADSDDTLPCSVSHDDRFAVAVAADGRPGIDVEKLSERVLKSQRLFMSTAEELVATSGNLDSVEAAVRIWSLKEAAAKAMNLDLAEAWRRTAVVQVEREESRFQIDSQGAFCAVHETVDDHVFTYTCLP